MNTPIASSIEPLSKPLSIHANLQTLSQPANPKSPAPWSVSTRTLTGETLIIRSAMASDAAALAAIGCKGFAATHRNAVPENEMRAVLASTWSEKELADLIANHEVQTMVAEVDQQIVGLACLNPTYRPTYLRRPKPVELGRFYLHLEWMGFGVGSALMVQALRQAAMQSFDICWLRVWQGNKSAIQFYRRWGFTTISADYYAVGSTLVPVWVMIHTLTTDATNDGKKAAPAIGAYTVNGTAVKPSREAIVH
jgi:GNAT superfamily N-acetyltransferase